MELNQIGQVTEIVKSSLYCLNGKTRLMAVELIINLNKIKTSKIDDQLVSLEELKKKCDFNQLKRELMNCNYLDETEKTLLQNFFE